MRSIKYIVVHCTDTPQTTNVETIQRYWQIKHKWKFPGYHYIIKANGDKIKLLDEDKVSNGVLGFNQESINVAFIGGRTKTGKSKNTITRSQENSLFDLIVRLGEKYPNAKVKGHCDFPNQGGRTCPNFNVTEWLKNYTPDLKGI